MIAKNRKMEVRIREVNLRHPVSVLHHRKDRLEGLQFELVFL